MNIVLNILDRIENWNIIYAEKVVKENIRMEKQINDTHNYPKCHGCPYYFGEIDSCMFGEDDVPDNLEKKCHNKTEKDIKIGE
jgi:hypothetical protein